MGFQKNDVGEKVCNLQISKEILVTFKVIKNKIFFSTSYNKFLGLNISVNYLTFEEFLSQFIIAEEASNKYILSW